MSRPGPNPALLPTSIGRGLGRRTLLGRGTLSGRGTLLPRSTLILTALLLVGLIAPSAGRAQQASPSPPGRGAERGADPNAGQWYRSTAEGERGAEISPAARDDFQWVLHIVSGEKRQEETLYRDARAVRRTVRDGAGELRYRERYSYYASGKLQEVARTYPDGRVVRSRYEFVGERLTAEWHETGEETRLVRYDDQGRTIAETHWVGDEVTQEVRYEYAGPRDRLPDRTVTENPSAGIEVVRRFDEQGRVVEIRRRRNGESPDVVSVVTRSYGEHGLTREQTERPGGSRSTEYEYTSDGELALRREYVDGTIAERVEFREENRRVRELYRHGELVLRVFLRGEERLREEIIRDGEVVEERRFGGNGAGGES